MIIPVPDEILPATSLGRVHFVGIGGAGLSGIARIMLALDVPVSGSDAKDSAALAALAALGARTFVGHDASHVDGVDTVVVSTAVREDNPEVVAAGERGLRLLPRSAALMSVMLGRRVLAVAGTHGKTTTTSLLTVALQHVLAHPTYAIGGDLSATGVNAELGSGPDFVAEADESDGAFLVYRPYAAIVTNVEADHLDNYGTVEAYHAAFTAFLERIDPGGFLVACVDDDGAARLADDAANRGLRVVRVGFGGGEDLAAVDCVFVGSTSAFTVLRRGEVLGRVHLQIPGRHYVLDALAALACGLELGHPFEGLAEGMGAYTGTARRMEPKGEAGAVRVVDSYAHHPQEIARDLEAARVVAGDGRLVVCFQPHLVSRTRVFGAEMGRALSAADVVVVLDVYLAREDADPAVTGELVAGHVGPGPEEVRFEPRRSEAARVLASLVRPGDLVLTLGAGDVTTVGPELLEILAGGER